MENRQELRVRILLDANRGSRGAVSSRTMLMPILNPSFDCRVGNILAKYELYSFLNKFINSFVFQGVYVPYTKIARYSPVALT